MIFKKSLITLTLLFPVIVSSGCGAGSKPNIVLIVIDTLRADHLGCYGYERNTSPSIDSLAETGITWLNVQGQSSWTLPAITTIYTGLNVREHGAGRRGNTVYAMNNSITTIPLFMKQCGYTTMGIFNIYLLSEQFGFNRGFDGFSCQWLGDGRAGVSVDEAIDWISELDGSTPFFLGLHIFDPHDPYEPPAPYDTLFTPSPSLGINWWPAHPDGSLDDSDENLEYLTGLYDGEIAWTDSQLERLFTLLRENGMDENTVIIVTADHGEEFLDHGNVGHGFTMHREIVHVPLIITGPGIPTDSVDNTLRCQLDILPTILDMVGMAQPEYLHGHTLLSSAVPSRAVPASNVNSLIPDITAAVTMGSRKLIWNVENNSSSMFDISSDPFEHQPLPPDSDLVDSVFMYWSTPAFMPARISDREAVEAVLRDLGYF